MPESRLHSAQESGAIYDKLLRGEATSAEYVEALHREHGGHLAIKVAEGVVAERDRMRRLFNRLEAAISHHKKAIGYEHDDMYEPWDEALYKARDKILRDYAEGKG